MQPQAGDGSAGPIPIRPSSAGGRSMAGCRDLDVTPRPIAVTDEQLARVPYDADGPGPAIVQDAATGQVLMMAWVNEETLRLSLAEGRTVFWSRSRQEVWRKGDTSGDVQLVRAAYYDCDGDTLLFVVDQQGGGRLPHRRALVLLPGLRPGDDPA